MNAFVAACEAAQSGSAESQRRAQAFFSLFRESPSVLQDCRYILDSPETAVPYVARFHAARLLGEIAVVKWSQLDRGSQSALRHYLFAWVLARGNHTITDPVERAAMTKAAQAFAVIAKREWLDLAAEGVVKGLLESWRGQVSAEQTPSKRTAAARIFLSLIQEFNSFSTKAVGLSRAWHGKARENFEQLGFPMIIQLALDRTLVLVSEGAVVAKEPAMTTELVAWLSLVEEAFVWFSAKDGVVKRGSGGTRTGTRTTIGGASLPLIRLDARWHDVLLRSEIVQCYFAARQQLRSVPSSEALTHINSILIYFASLGNTNKRENAGIFSSVKERLGFCGAMLNFIMQAAQQQLGIGSAPGPRRDAAQVDTLFIAQAVRQIVTNFGLSSLLQLANGLQLVQAIGELLNSTLKVAMTVALENVKQRCLPPDPHDASMEAFDCLLEAWVVIISEADDVTKRDSSAVVSHARGQPSHREAPKQYNNQQVEQLQNCVKSASSSVFEALLHFRLHIASSVIVAGVDDDDEFEDITILESQMVSVCLSGRQNCSSECEFLRRELALRIQGLNTVRAGGSMIGKLPGLDGTCTAAHDPVVQAHALLDQIWWLCHFLGYFLVDLDSTAGDTEPPMIPHEFICSNDAKNLVIALTTKLFELVDLETNRVEVYAGEGKNSDSSSDSSLSPLLHEKLLWLLRRWAGAYLMPDESMYTMARTNSSSSSSIGYSNGENLNRELLAKYGSASPIAAQMVGYIVTKSTLLLAYWPTEPGVTTAVCALLKNVCSHAKMRRVAVESPAFSMLMSAFGEATCPSLAEEANGVSTSGTTSSAAKKWITEGLRSLPSQVAGQLSQVIAIACDASANASVLQGNLRTAAAPTFVRLQEITSHAAFSTTYSEDVVKDEVLRLLHMMCGIARASSLTNLTVLFDMCAPTFGGIVRLVEVYCSSSTHIVAQCLSFFADFSEAQCSLLDPGRSCSLFNAIQTLLSTYGPSKCNLTSSWSTLRRTQEAGSSAEADEIVAEIVLVLRVLSQMSNKANADWFDFESPQQHQLSEQASKILDATIVLGLRVAVPSMTPNVLAYPQVCREYFKFLSFAVEAYPGRILSEAEGSNSLLGQRVSQGALASITFGLQHHDTVVLRQSLRALQEIAEYSAKNAGLVTGRGAKQLPANQTAHPVNSPSLQKLLRLLLSMLLERQNVHISEVVGDSAGPLLALIICEQPTFARIAQAHIEKYSDASVRSSLSNAFQHLLSVGGVANNRIDRRNRTQFRKNLRSFLEVARGHN